MTVDSGRRILSPTFVTRDTGHVPVRHNGGNPLDTERTYWGSRVTRRGILRDGAARTISVKLGSVAMDAQGRVAG